MDGCDVVPYLSYVEECEHVELLVDKLSHFDDARRRKGAEALACYIGEQRCLPPGELQIHPAAVIAEFMTSTIVDKNVCIQGAKALGFMGPHAAPFASKALANLLEHHDMDIRWEVARAIRYLGPAAAQDVAKNLATLVTEDEFPIVRHQAARALEALGPAASEDAAASLGIALDDEDLDVQNAAIRALGVMGPKAAPGAAESLAKTMISGRYEMRMLAADALASMGEAAAKIAGSALDTVLRPDGLPWSAGWQPPGSDCRLRRRSAEVLASMGPEVVAEHEVKLARALGDVDPSVVQAVASTLQGSDRSRAVKGSMAFFKCSRLCDFDDEERDRKSMNLAKVKDMLSRYDATNLEDWFVEEMGVEAVADAALITEAELVEKGMKSNQAAKLIQEANTAEDRRAFEALLSKHKAIDLANWLTVEMNVTTVAEIAQMDEEELVEEGPMSRPLAKQLLENAKMEAAAIAAAKAEAAEAAAEAAREAELAEDREAALDRMLAHAEHGVCWCGEDHDAPRRAAAEALEKEIQQKKVVEEKRVKEERTRELVAKRKREREAAEKRKRADEKALAEAKLRAHELELKRKKDAAAELKRKQLEEAKRVAMRGTAWMKPGKVYTYDEWAGKEGKQLPKADD
eukprot:TRINITY_DN11723_c0_g1_i2.p1 TRINITY_DN11723_c0_g1~~TRINITY_DN11723_c0_g1_i2.p1  ORF type:complete len:664 (-),score=160.21 TRINITY_DN11723_c0_g1_i2:79-1977(-)